MKILHIITASEWGGAQEVCYNIAVNLKQKGVFVEVACSPGGLLVNKLRESNIPARLIYSFRRKFFSPFCDLKTFFSLYSLIKRDGYDIVHCHSTKAGFLGRLAAKFAHIPKIYFTVHGWSFYTNYYKRARWFLTLLEKISALFSDKIICVSDFDKQEGLRRKIAPERKFIVIKNGVVFNFVSANESLETRRTLGIMNQEVVVGMAGRLTDQKNPLLFLRAAKEIYRKYNEAKFVLLGEGDLSAQCRNFVVKNNLAGKILLLGGRPPGETRKIISSFDIFVLTSRFEGLPLVLIEAMFAKKPIVASDVCGNRELIKGGENGFLAELSPESFAEKISRLIENPRLRLLAGQNGYNMASANFTLGRMLGQYNDLYGI